MANIVDTAIKMEVLLIRPSQVLTNPTTSNSPQNTCLCCSNTLLRHISLRGMYWRCSSCYQEMPAQKSLQELRFTHDRVSLPKKCSPVWVRKYQRMISCRTGRGDRPAGSQSLRSKSKVKSQKGKDTEQVNLLWGFLLLTFELELSRSVSPWEKRLTSVQQLNNSPKH